MSKKQCPFCRRDVNKHHPQCHYGSIPTAEEIKDLHQKKKESDSRKLKNTKSALTEDDKRL